MCFMCVRSYVCMYQYIIVYSFDMLSNTENTFRTVCAYIHMHVCMYVYEPMWQAPWPYTALTCYQTLKTESELYSYVFYVCAFICMHVPVHHSIQLRHVLDHWKHSQVCMCIYSYVCMYVCVWAHVTSSMTICSLDLLSNTENRVRSVCAYIHMHVSVCVCVCIHTYKYCTYCRGNGCNLDDSLCAWFRHTYTHAYMHTYIQILHLLSWKWMQFGWFTLRMISIYIHAYIHAYMHTNTALTLMKMDAIWMIHSAHDVDFQLETFLHMYVCVCVYVCVYVCMHIYMYVRMYVGSCTFVHSCMYVCMHACMHVWMYAFMCAFV